MTALTKEERTEIADEALAIAERFADEPLASRAELLQMSESELDDYFRSRGVVLDWEQIIEETRGQVGADVVLRMNRGEALMPGTAADLDERARKAVVQGARETANQALADMWHAAFAEADDRPEDERYGMWLTVVGAGPSCPDCRSLHGTVFLMDYWEGNMPCDGHTQCKKRCRCRVVPCGSPGKRNEGLRNDEARRVLDS
jgi:hypothetical protein